MSGKELWGLFVKKNDIAETDYEEFAFGDDSDLLAHLVKIGEKTATASAYPLYELEDEPLPKVGSYSVVLDSKDNAVCIIKTTKVRVVPFNEISKEHAYKEGEGDKTLDYWKRVHEDFFSKCLNEVGLKFTLDMKVVCQSLTTYRSGSL